MSFMPFGKTGLPSTSVDGDTKYKDKKCEFKFTLKDGQRRLYCRMENFKDKKPFECDITLADPGDESIVMATPFYGNERAFYYNQKINCMPAGGFAEFDGKRYVFPEDSFGTLDWGRGVWTYSNTWYWGSASGLVSGKRFGFNLGYGFGDTSAASENVLFYDGSAHKLEDVCFNIPMDENGKEDYMKPWTFSSSDGRLELDFVPVIDRASCTSAVVIKSDQHQVFGRFSGKVVLDDGEVIVIKDLLGFAEKVLNKW